MIGEVFLLIQLGPRATTCKRRGLSTLPELPEVETMCRGISPIVGHRIAKTSQPPCERRPILFYPAISEFDGRTRGRYVAGIDRLGKRVLICLDDGQTIVIEPRMTGLVLLADPPTVDHLRLRLELRGSACDQMLFWDRRGLGTVRLLTSQELDRNVRQKLGPDALRVTTNQMRDRLAASRRVIKVALLDQSAIAGIGNLYASEILFLAGVDPRTRCCNLSKPQWKRIQAAIGAVLNHAIEHEGSTLSDGTYRNALNNEGNYQNYHRVYDRAEMPCKRCGQGAIRRVVQCQRSTFFCPVCQRKTGIYPAVEP